MDKDDEFLRAGSAGDFAASRGLDQLPFIKRLQDHPTYDAFWQAQALDEILPKRTPSVPTLWIAGQWDQEDIYGAVAAFRALQPTMFWLSVSRLTVSSTLRRQRVAYSCRRSWLLRVYRTEHTRFAPTQRLW
jgi:predicted acyl esterase